MFVASRRRHFLVVAVPLLAVAVLSGANGTPDSTFSANIGSGFDGSVMSVRIQNDDAILVTGSFSHINGINSEGVARLSADGTPDALFSSHLGSALPDNSLVMASALQADGRIVVGGIFGTENLPHSFIKRLNVDGSEDAAFAAAVDAQSGLDRPVRAVVIQADGRIVVTDGSSSTHIVRLNADGTRDMNFTANVGTGFNGSVMSLALQPDGRIAAAGAFTALNGTPANHVARLHPDGRPDIPFSTNTGAGLNEAAMAVAVQADGRVLVGGFFATANGIASKCVARFNADGTVDTAFSTNLGSGCDGNVQALAVQPGGIVLGGVFNTVNGVSSSRSARLNPDGSVDTAFSSNLGGGFTTGFNDAAVRALAFQSDGSIVAGGDFEQFNSMSSRRLARIGAAPTVQADRATLTFSAVINGTAFVSQTSRQTVRLTQSGAGTVTWTAASSEPWLVVSPASGSGTAAFEVSVQPVPGLTTSQNGTITLTLHGAANTVAPIGVALTVFSNGASGPPVGSFDTPTDGSTGVAGSIAVTGWALDDVEVTRVAICRDPVFDEVANPQPLCSGTNKIFIGDAAFVDGARPDVQATFPNTPLNTRAGWGYLMLTNFLPNLGNGTFALHAFAVDADGHATVLGTKTITCANGTSAAPFGAIDTPSQGGVIGGSAYNNFGWVLSPSPNYAAPPDGGSVSVLIDGVNVGSPSLWTARSDLTALFQAAAYPGINHAAGVFTFDTTTLANGVHTIAWIVTGSPGGGSSGVGSRFFTVSNGTGGSSIGSAATKLIAAVPVLEIPRAAARGGTLTPEMLTNVIVGAALHRAPLRGRRGYDLNAPMRPYTADRNGLVTVQSHELDRIEVQLGRGRDERYTGYLRVADGVAPLPVGATLNPETGTFTWMPGAGFVGAYDLTFVRWSGDSAAGRHELRIVLNPGAPRLGPQTIIDTPAAGVVVGLPFVVAGWAADLDAEAGSGVDSVHVWAYPVNASGYRQDPIFLGAASYGGTRPDVAQLHRSELLHSGYGLTVQGLAAGTYDIAVFARSTVRNEFATAKVVRLTVRGY